MSNLSFSKKGVLTLLVIIILIGSFLRLHDLGEENLWIDEAFSLHHAKEKNLASVSGQVGTTEAAPLGYYLLLHYWVKLFGDSEFSVRMPSAIFGILSILMIFLLIRLFFDRKVALLSSFFLATSMLQIVYSQEARIYSMFTFLTLFSAYFFFRWYMLKKEGKDGLIYSAAYFLSILAAIYTNYLAVVLVALYSFILFFTWGTSKKFFARWAMIHCAVLIASLSLLPNLINQFTSINHGLSETLVAKGVPSLIAGAGIFFFAIPFIMLLFGLSGIFLLRNKLKKFILNVRIKDSLFVVLVLVWGIFYIYLTKNSLYLLGINVIQKPITNSYFLIRHPFFLVSFIYIFIAYKITNMKERKLAVICLLLIVIVNSFSLSTYYESTTKAEWEEAVSYITDRDSSPLVLVDKGGFSNLFLLDYYSREPMEIIKLTWTKDREPKMVDLDELNSILEKRESFWLILARGNGIFFEEYLDENYKSVESKDFYEIEVVNFVKKD